jgi:hypothetical protein
VRVAQGRMWGLMAERRRAGEQRVNACSPGVKSMIIFSPLHNF